MTVPVRPRDRLRAIFEPPTTTDDERAHYEGHALRRFQRGYTRGAVGGAVGAAIGSVSCLPSSAPWARVGLATGLLLVAAQLSGALLNLRWTHVPLRAAWYNMAVGIVAAAGVGVAAAVGAGLSSWGAAVILLFWLFGATTIAGRPRHLAVAMVGHCIAFCTPILLLRSSEGFVPFALVMVSGALACATTAWVRDAADLRHYIAARRSRATQADTARAIAQLVQLSADLAGRVDGLLATVLERRRDVQRLHRMLHAPEVDRSLEIAAALRQSTPDTDEPYKPGTVVGGRARIERFLASGGFGDVFLALDLTLREEVVVKVMRSPISPEPARIKRFLLEAAAAAAVDHPAIVRVFHVDVDGSGSPFLICERVVGRTLRSVVDDGRIEPAHAIAIASVVVDALCAVHGAGLVHRDVKPDNIMLSRKAPSVRLLDFGVTQWVGEDFDLTNAGELIGSLGYMAPERFMSRGAAALGSAGDVFAVGMLLYECLAGAHPLDGLATFAIVERMSRGEFPRLSTAVDALPTELCDLVHWMLQPEPEARPTMAAVATALTVIDQTSNPQTAVGSLLARGEPDGDARRVGREEATLGAED